MLSATTRTPSGRRQHRDDQGHLRRIVLVHGFTQTGASWAAIADALADDGFEVITVDAPGHGGSSAVRADLWGGAELLTDTGGPATYVGYSMGARLALHAALLRPNVVRRLVLLGATAGIEDAAERAQRRTDDERLASELERDGIGAFLDRCA